jgi:hypothetical protein
VSTPGTPVSDQKERLLVTLKLAVAAVNDAEQSVTTAKAELVSRSTRVGMLLLEAKKLHPAVKDFDAFLKEVDGLGLSRAYDLMRLAGGRKRLRSLRASLGRAATLLAEREGQNELWGRPLERPNPIELTREAYRQ